MSQEATWVGRPLPQKGAAEKATGRARYLDDITLPGMLHAKILRSPHAHARLLGIDTRAARELPGVRAVLTGIDCPPIPFGLDQPDTYVLAREKVRYQGEEVAAVAAETPRSPNGPWN